MRLVACRPTRLAISCACSTTLRAARWPAPACGSASESIYLEPLLGRRGGAVSRAALGGAAGPGGAAAPRRPRPRQGDRSRSGSAGLVLRRDRPAGLGGLALRPDRLERLAAAARSRKAAALPATTSSPASPASRPPICAAYCIALGYRAVIADGAELFVARPRRARPVRPHPARHLSAARAIPSPSSGSCGWLERQRPLCAGKIEPAARPVVVVRALREEPLACGAALRRRCRSRSTASPSPRQTTQLSPATSSSCSSAAGSARCASWRLVSAAARLRKRAACSRKPPSARRALPGWEPLLFADDGDE